MNKKGFTIIELLGIVIIIGVIGIVSFNSIVGTIERNQVRQEKAFSEQVINAASLYVTANLADFEELEYSSNNMYIDVTTLIEKGFIKKDIDNPTAIETEDYFIEVYKNSEGVLDYKLVTEKNLNYKDSILNGSEPELEENFIPVTIENDGTVKKANTDNEWYNYAEKKWANVVLVDLETKETYINAAENTIINPNDIEAYLVWIPRYKYKISSSTITENPKNFEPSSTPDSTSIDIIFENKTTPKSKGDAINTYYSHPAFTFGSDELNGIWVGKFETSGSSNTLPQILPNKPAFTNIDITAAFVYSKTLNFDISTVNPEQLANLFVNYTLPSKFDPHLIKNSEWGAVAYLSHSNYGINYEVRVNNNEFRVNYQPQYTTGCGGTKENPSLIAECQIPYGGASYYPQSTTGNITGIFDMAGGTYELTMAYDRAKKKYLNTLDSPDMFNKIDKKYYEEFDVDTINSSDRMLCNNKLCKGYAFNETNRWYNDYNSISGYFISRGGYAASSSGGGLFSYTGYYSPADYYGFRITVAMTEVKG